MFWGPTFSFFLYTFCFTGVQFGSFRKSCLNEHQKNLFFLLNSAQLISAHLSSAQESAAVFSKQIGRQAAEKQNNENRYLHSTEAFKTFLSSYSSATDFS